MIFAFCGDIMGQDSRSPLFAIISRLNENSPDIDLSGLFS